MEKKGHINYRNDNGEIITKEEYDALEVKFQTEVDNAYNAKANEILDNINNNAFSDVDKLWMLFDYLSNERMTYDLQYTDGIHALDHGYLFSNYKTKKIYLSTKYPVLINNKGVCETYSKAFEDLSNKLGIPCRRVIGFTGMEHSWNIVLINDKIKHIDVTFAITHRKSVDKKNFFLKDYFTDRTIYSNITELDKDMREQYKKENNKSNQVQSRSNGNMKENQKFKVSKRNDKHTMKVKSRSDSNIEENRKFKVFNRTDKSSMQVISRTDGKKEESNLTFKKK